METKKVSFIKELRKSIFDTMLKKGMEPSLTSETTITFIWKGLKVEKNIYSEVVGIYDATGRDYELITNKFLLYLVHKELCQNSG